MIKIGFRGILTITIGRFILMFNHWQKPLHTQHARPRKGRAFDWFFCLGNNVGPLRILWLYNRAKDGTPRGRTIEWWWRPSQKNQSTPSRCPYQISPPWHYPLLKPYRVPALGLFVWAFWDCSYTAVSLTKLHLFDIFIPHYRKWWQLPICGFQIWGCIKNQQGKEKQ